MKVPSPLNGWRVFCGEVGIIVLGVLLALGAQQVVEAANWRREVSDFREAIDEELGKNLSIYKVRLEQNECVARRLAELQQLADFPTGAPAPKRQRPIATIDSYSYFFSVWDNKDADVMAHLPLKVRTKYAEIYDEFLNEERNRTNENAVWRSMARFNLAEPMTHDDRRQLTEMLADARRFDSNRRYNHPVALALTDALGIKARPLPYAIEGAGDFCKPLFAQLR